MSRIKNFVLVVALLTGCASTPSEGRPPQTNVEDQPASSLLAESPENPTSPACQPAASYRQGFTLAVLTLGGTPQEEVLMHTERKLTPLDASPDGRYVLTNTPVSEPRVPAGLALVDTVTDSVMVSDANGHRWMDVRWSGQGFLVGPLLHLDLELRVSRYEQLREALGIGDKVSLVASDFSPDGKTVTVITIPTAYDIRSLTRGADFVIAKTNGEVLRRLDSVIRPWIVPNVSAHVRISPDGRYAAIQADSPQAVIVDLKTPDPFGWTALGGTTYTVGSTPVERSGPLGLPAVWAPDSKHVWVPVRNTVASVSTGETRVERGDWPVIWYPDGQSLLSGADSGTIYRRTWLDGRSEPVALPNGFKPLRFLHDGRLLGFYRQ